jgi:hypothetical protein
LFIILSARAHSEGEETKEEENAEKNSRDRENM